MKLKLKKRNQKKKWATQHKDTHNEGSSIILQSVNGKSMLLEKWKHEKQISEKKIKLKQLELRIYEDCNGN